MKDLQARHARLVPDRELDRVDELLTQALSLAASPSRHSAATAAPMCEALAEACRLARARAMQPEQMIIMMKGVWGRMRDAQYATRDLAQEALDRAVSACIREYFAEDTGPAGRPRSTQQ